VSGFGSDDLMVQVCGDITGYFPTEHVSATPRKSFDTSRGFEQSTVGEG
jgi:hypothetical protein